MFIDSAYFVSELDILYKKILINHWVNKTKFKIYCICVLLNSTKFQANWTVVNLLLVYCIFNPTNKLFSFHFAYSFCCRVYTIYSTFICNDPLPPPPPPPPSQKKPRKRQYYTETSTSVHMSKWRVKYSVIR